MSQEIPVWNDGPAPGHEGLTIPAQVNYVGMAADLKVQNFRYSGAAMVAVNFLRNGYLWDKIRVQGGAYGAFCGMDRHAGTLTFSTYRDPSMGRSLEIFGRVADYLEKVELSDREMAKCVIGSIGEMDPHRLPAAKGYIELLRRLLRDTPEKRARIREEVLNATVQDFRDLATVFREAAANSVVTLLGSEDAVQQAATGLTGTVKVIKVL